MGLITFVQKDCCSFQTMCHVSHRHLFAGSDANQAQQHDFVTEKGG